MSDINQNESNEVGGHRSWVKVAKLELESSKEKPSTGGDNKEKGGKVKVRIV